MAESPDKNMPLGDLKLVDAQRHKLNRTLLFMSFIWVRCAGAVSFAAVNNNLVQLNSPKMCILG